jgi:hypothetical protein
MSTKEKDDFVAELRSHDHEGPPPYDWCRECRAAEMITELDAENEFLNSQLMAQVDELAQTRKEQVTLIEQYTKACDALGAGLREVTPEMVERAAKAIEMAHDGITGNPSPYERRMAAKDAARAALKVALEVT